MTTKLVRVHVTEASHLSANLAHPNPRLIVPGDVLPFGRTNLADCLLPAIADPMRLVIPSIFVGGKPLNVEADIYSLSGPGLEAHVRLVASSGVQLNRHETVGPT